MFGAAMDDASKATVKIFGQVYNLTCEGQEDYLKELAAFVDSRMREIARTTQNVDTLKTAVLTALNIADEYFQLKKTTEHSQSSVRNESEDTQRDSKEES